MKKPLSNERGFGEAGVGFEPTNDGFANRCLRPLGYPAEEALPLGKV